MIALHILDVSAGGAGKRKMKPGDPFVAFDLP
jgi:hypothetical protein